MACCPAAGEHLFGAELSASESLEPWQRVALQGFERRTESCRTLLGELFATDQTSLRTGRGSRGSGLTTCTPILHGSSSGSGYPAEPAQSSSFRGYNNNGNNQSNNQTTSNINNNNNQFNNQTTSNNNIKNSNNSNSSSSRGYGTSARRSSGGVASQGPRVAAPRHPVPSVPASSRAVAAHGGGNAALLQLVLRRPGRS
ncbi:unnamed protein product, partial [Polarella glacialis]